MTDREKVIKGVKMCISPDLCSPNDCPYYIRPDKESGLCWERLMTDIIALLKEQATTLNRLRSTMEDMVRGNASEEVSYLLRLMDKWEKGA